MHSYQKKYNYTSIVEKRHVAQEKDESVLCIVKSYLYLCDIKKYNIASIITFKDKVQLFKAKTPSLRKDTQFFLLLVVRPIRVGPPLRPVRGYFFPFPRPR